MHSHMEMDVAPAGAVNRAPQGRQIADLPPVEKVPAFPHSHVQAGARFMNPDQAIRAQLTHLTNVIILARHGR